MRNCLVCDGSGEVRRLGKNGLLGSPVLYCETCRLAFTSAEPDEIRSKLQEVYRASYWQTAGKRDTVRGLLTPGLYGTRLSAELIQLVRTIGIPSSKVIAHHDIIQRCATGKTLLEIGAGYGHALAYFKARHFDVQGIEPDEVNCVRINQRFGAGVCRAGDAETMEIDGQFDVIYLSHVFEHLVDPLGFLRKIRHNLRSGGIVVVEVPNCDNEAVRKTSILDHSHLYHFSTTCLSRLLQKADYKPIEVQVYRNRSRGSVGLLVKQVLRRNDYEQAPQEVGDRIVLVGQPR